MFIEIKTDTLKNTQILNLDFCFSRIVTISNYILNYTVYYFHYRSETL